ncbi:MAG: hypothetical protein MI724_11345 [Spirochaetales bacterium]|nr:hypothetical protein [Spirochaetales bacterium]
MTITHIEAIPVSVPLRYPFKAAYGVRDSADFVVVKVHADNGMVGLGEAATIPIYDDGSQGGVVYCIERHLAPLLIGEDPRRIGALHERMDAALKGARYAKSAIDYALYDITARFHNLPVYQLLGGYNRPVEVTAVFGADDTSELLVQAEAKKREGYRVFKLKIGSNHKRDVERVRLLREVIGEEAELRLDGNESWRGIEARCRINDFRPSRPAHIEQPLPRWDVSGLGALRRTVSVPVAVDEAAVSPHDVHRVVSYAAGDLLNVKTARSGGLFPSLKVAAVAEAAGIPPFVGSMLELGVGTVANGHFAAALTGGVRATELVGPQFVKRDILKVDLVYENGYLRLPEGPGWGVELDEAALREFRC